MKAIVLSYDKQIGFAELVYKLYMEKWIDCPLTFRIPWNKEVPTYFKNKPNVELVQCDSSMRPTMLALLDGIGDEEWVYWCIDDRYPKEVINPSRLSALHDYVYNPDLSHDFDAVKLFKWREREVIKDAKECVLLGGSYEIQTIGHEWGYYHHQFCRSKYLKNIFLSNSLPENYGLIGPEGVHQELLSGNSLKDMRVLLPKEPDIMFGEPMIGGKITPEGERYMAEYECPLPKYKKTKRDKYFK